MIADAGDDLQECYIDAHEFTRRLDGGVVAEAAVFSRTVQTPWREAPKLAGLELRGETPIGQVLETAAVYSANGVFVLPRTTAEIRAARILEIDEDVEALDVAIPHVSWGVEAPAVARIARTARGRWALDHGESIEAPALARLAGVSERRIRMSTGEAGLQAEKGRVTAASALAWRDRDGFHPSAWREDARFDAMTRSEPLGRDEIRFVPIARKGEMFHPGLLRNGAYMVCKDDEEIDLEDDEFALEVLKPPLGAVPASAVAEPA